jgi:hypothetical protein
MNGAEGQQRTRDGMRNPWRLSLLQVFSAKMDNGGDTSQVDMTCPRTRTMKS